MKIWVAWGDIPYRFGETSTGRKLSAKGGGVGWTSTNVLPL